MSYYSISLTDITHFGVVGNTSLSQGQTNISASVWVKAGAQGGNREILGCTSAATAQGGYAVYQQTDRAGALNYTFYKSDASLNSHKISGATALLDGNWHNVVCVYAGSGTNIHIYVDGIETSYIDTNSGLSGSGWTSIVPWCIGDSTGLVGTFVSLYAYPAIFYSALSAGDAATIAAGANLAGAEAQWLFTEGSGVTAVDSSGNNHTLTFNTIDAWSADVPFTPSSGPTAKQKAAFGLVF